jgi:hypothetical protein
MVRNDKLILFQEHVANRDCFIQKSARVSAHIQNQSIKLAGIQFLQRICNFAVRCFIK